MDDFSSRIRTLARRPCRPFLVCLLWQLLLLATPLSPATADQRDDSLDSLCSQLDRLLTSHGQAKVRMGASVIELPSGSVLYDNNGDQPLLPASNMKLITIAAAIDRLGGEHKLKTTLAARNKDLVIVGSGDPLIGDEELCGRRGQAITAIFHDWADKLKAAGVKQVAGNIVIDDSVFDRRFVQPNWPPDQLQRHYEAPVGGLNFADNCISVRVAPTKLGQRASAALTPGNELIRLENKTVTGGKQTATAGRQPNSDTIIAAGSVARPETVGPVTIRDPGLYFGHVFKTVLASEGIKVTGEVVRERVRDQSGELPKDYRIIAVHETPLPLVLARAGKDSHGLSAEAVFKLLGSVDAESGSWKTGHDAVEAFLRKAGVAEGQITVDDGSGLSRNNRVSAAAMTKLLRYMYAAPGDRFQTLRQSLSVAGTDGTLEKRMRSPQAKGRIMAKTGYINGVRTLAGYLQTSGGEWLAFAFYYNQATSTRPLTRIQDQACELLLEWPNIKTPAPQPATPRGTNRQARPSSKASSGG